MFRQYWAKTEYLVIGSASRRSVELIEKAITARTVSYWLSKLGLKWKNGEKKGVQ